MISIADYFGGKFDHPDATPERKANAEELLRRVRLLLDCARLEGAYDDWVDEDTATEISGSRNGQGDGGFRLQVSKVGAPKSSHKEGMAVDVYDPFNQLDKWITDAVLEEFDLYREHPDATRGWCHLQSRPPRSGKRTYLP